jgi:hypothetical protein
MKLYLYLILVIMFSFSSCKGIKFSAMNKIYSDSTSFDYVYGYESKGTSGSSKNIIIRDGYSIEHLENEKIIKNEKIIENKTTNNIKKAKQIKKTIIINKIDSAKLENGNGVVTYQIPEKLNYGETYIFKLRISSKSKISINNLLVDKKNITITTNPDVGPIILEDIKISEYMSANLWGDSNGFEIYPLNTLKQKINNETFTEWSWKVKPIKSGHFYIKLTINIDDIDHNVYEKDMLVYISIKDRMYLFIMNNYQWLWSTLFVPFLIPWIKKKLPKKYIVND